MNKERKCDVCGTTKGIIYWVMRPNEEPHFECVECFNERAKEEREQ